MTDNMPFDPRSTYAFLRGAMAGIMPGGEAFWNDIPESVEHGEGWLVGAYEMHTDTRNWEMHPEGDELLVLLSGALDIILEEASGERTVALEAGQTCLVPRGTWHRQGCASAGGGAGPDLRSGHAAPSRLGQR